MVTTNDSLGRRSRMRPQPTGKTMRIGERDLLWMQKLHEHGSLSSKELIAFGQHLAGNQARAQNRLTDLFNEIADGEKEPYLRRPPQQFQTIDARYQPLVYDLTKAGARLLKNYHLYQEPQARSPGPWWHGKMVASITAGIELDCISREDRNYIPGWQVLQRAEAILRYPTTFTDPVSGRVVTKDLIPDSLYGSSILRRRDHVIVSIWSRLIVPLSRLCRQTSIGSRFKGRCCSMRSMWGRPGIRSI